MITDWKHSNTTPYGSVFAAHDGENVALVMPLKIGINVARLCGIVAGGPEFRADDVYYALGHVLHELRVAESSYTMDFEVTLEAPTAIAFKEIER